MNFVLPMIRWVSFMVFFLPAQLCAQSAEIVWAEIRNEAHKIMYSAFDGDSWSPSTTIQSSEKTISSPSLMTASNGAKFLIWSEQRKAKSVLMYSVKGGEEREWGQPSVFSRLGIENVSPSIVRDANGDYWVFWSADLGNYTDVFYSKTNAGGWSEPIRVNSPNKVPDIRPFARINELAQVQVRWQNYDFDAGAYVPQINTYEVPARSDQNTQGESEAEQFESEYVRMRELKLPMFLPPESHAIVHMPGNKFVQNSRVHQSVVLLNE